ncbi:MAG: hypothetical protein P8J33_13650 [Pirellulaceae bacterium]|nr:hypothetical protein [Pirellulaceae bacterium]
MHETIKIIAVNNPGGQPRQFCVQVRDTQFQNWKRSGVFLDQASADSRNQELQQSGKEARIVHYRLPTAA